MRYRHRHIGRILDFISTCALLVTMPQVSRHAPSALLARGTMAPPVPGVTPVLVVLLHQQGPQVQLAV